MIRCLVSTLTSVSNMCSYTHPRKYFLASSAVANGILSPISYLTERLSETQNLARPAFNDGYPTWLKTFNFMCQVLYMPLDANQPRRYIKEYTLSWTRLGKALGYFDQLKYTPCSYPRCSSGKEISSGFMACKVCLDTVYCSGRCQQA